MNTNLVLYLRHRPVISAVIDLIDSIGRVDMSAYWVVIEPPVDKCSVTLGRRSYRPVELWTERI